VWVLDPEHDTARSRPIELGAQEGELVVVTAGLDLSDKLLEPLDGGALRAGERVRVQGARR
jgi:multidrug efflux pump subunit AcrA (membrane-fusion protein)